MVTKVITYRFIKLFVRISTLLLILSSCDIIDSIFGPRETENPTDTQQQEINTVISIQNNTAAIMDNLFSSGLDILTVKDSIAKIFINDPSVKNVWINNEGIAVEYDNGIAGGIFIDRIKHKKAGKKSNQMIQEMTGKKYDNKDLRTVKPINSIYVGSAMSEFWSEDSLIIYGSRDHFAWASLPFFEYHAYTDNAATLEVYKSLYNFGVVHLSGHGWPWPVEPDSSKGFKEVYLLTGQEVSINNIPNLIDYWADILAQDIAIIYYDEAKQNRCWIGPKFITTYNNFNTDSTSTAIWGGFCYGFRGNWPKELVNNRGAKAYISYDWSVYGEEDAEWAVDFYSDMCWQSVQTPYTIDMWYNNLVTSGKDFHLDDDDPTIITKIKYKGDPNFTFWQYNTFKELVGACETFHLMGDIIYIDDIVHYELTEWDPDSLHPPPCFSRDKFPLWEHGNDYPPCDDTLNASLEIWFNNYPLHSYEELIDGDLNFYHFANGDSADSYWEYFYDDGTTRLTRIKLIQIAFNDSRDALEGLAVGSETNGEDGKSSHWFIGLNKKMPVNTTNLFDIKFNQAQDNNTDWIWYEINSKKSFANLDIEDTDGNFFSDEDVLSVFLKLYLYIPNSNPHPPGG